MCLYNFYRYWFFIVSGKREIFSLPVEGASQKNIETT